MSLGTRATCNIGNYRKISGTIVIVKKQFKKARPQEPDTENKAFATVRFVPGKTVCLTVAKFFYNY